MTDRLKGSPTMAKPSGQPSKPPTRRLPRSVWMLSWVSFFADVSSEMIYPLLPLFMVAVLGANKTQLGIMEGAAVLIVAGLAVWSGHRSDRTRRRVPWMRWGYGLPVLGKSLIALATVWPMAVAGRWLDRIGKGLRGAPRDALIVDLVDHRQRGRAFGLHRAFDTAGALLGVLIAAWLLWWLAGTPAGADDQAAQAVPVWVYRAVLGVGAVLGLASWLLMWWVRDVSGNEEERASVETDPNAPAPPAGPEDTTGDGSADALSRPKGSGWQGLPSRYWITLTALGLFALANSSDVFLLLRASELGFSPWAVVMVYATFNVTYALLSYPAGAWSDAIGRWKVIGTGWLLYVVVYAGMSLVTVDQSQWVWLLMGLYGLYMALTEGVGKALIADCAPSALRGKALGIFHATVGICGLLASVLAGVVWDIWSGSAAFMLGAVFAALALVMVSLSAVNAARNQSNSPDVYG